MNREALVGKSVIGLDAILVGIVKDLAISSDGKIAIQVDRSNASFEDKDDLYLSSDEVLAIGEVVLLRHSSSLVGKTTSEPSAVPPIAPLSPATTGPPIFPAPSTGAVGKVCPRCNYNNSALSKFCIKCGSSLP